MPSPYFKLKIKTNEFKDNVNNILDKNKNKKVLFYGVNKDFISLNRIYNFTKNLNIVAFVDEKLKSGNTSSFCGIKSISVDDISRDEFDTVIVTNENYQPATIKLETELLLNPENIFSLFIDSIPEERQNINFLYKNKFNKTYPKLVKKMKNKKVVLYGAGIFLETINKFFDLSQLNIIGIVDKKYSIINNTETFMGYKTYNPCEIKDLNPDCVLISTKFFIGIFEYLHFNILQGSKIKVKPLMQKSFWTLIKEVIES